MTYLKGKDATNDKATLIIPISNGMYFYFNSADSIPKVYIYSMLEKYTPIAVLNLTLEEVEQQLKEQNNDNN